MRVILLLCCVLALNGLAGPATSPSTQPDNLSERQASILLQLSNAEANIKTINKALKLTGYKVGLAYEQVEGSAKANELMDRRGGGPVPWDQFYGKTAMSFYHHASADLHVDEGHGAAKLDAQWTGSRLTKIDRPAQFDAIYRANDQQSARAKEQIASLMQDQAALLARRQKHEMDQSALWASLAWERIADREIAFRPQYRYQLAPAGPRDALLRGPILFLVTLDKATSEAFEAVSVDQPATFVQLHTVTKNAYITLQESLATAAIAQGVSDDDRRQVDALKSLCKQLMEQCVVADDNFRQAVDSDRAKEDASKLEYRAALQSSLAKIAMTAVALDDRLSATAEAWGLKPITGSPSPNRLPAKLLNIAPKPSAGAPPATSLTTPAAPIDNAAARSDMSLFHDLIAHAQMIRPQKDFELADPVNGRMNWPGGDVHLKGTVQAGSNDQSNGKKFYPGEIVVPAGASIEGGTLHVSCGWIHLEGTSEHPVILRNVEINCTLSTTFVAKNAIFDHCKFYKSGRYWEYGVKWTFQNCLFNQSNFKALSRTDYGLDIERCAFVDCKPPERSWNNGNDKGQPPQIAKLVAGKWNRFDECDFYNCEIPVQTFWATRRCNFTTCKVTGRGPFSGKLDLALELGIGDDDRLLVNDLRVLTEGGEGEGRVTYSVAPKPFANAVGPTR